MAEIQVVKAGKAALMLADELRLEGALAVAGNVNAQGADVSQHGLGALAIAVIGGSPFGLVLARRVAQVVAHLRAQRTFKNRLLELLEDPLKLGWRHRPGNELLKQFG